MDENEVLDVQETSGEDNNGIVTDGLEPEVVDPNNTTGGSTSSGDAGGQTVVEDEEDEDDPVTPPTPPVHDDQADPAYESSEEAKLNAHKYYCMQMMQIMPGL